MWGEGGAESFDVRSTDRDAKLQRGRGDVWRGCARKRGTKTY